MAACCCLLLDSCLDSSLRTAKFGIECIADASLLSKNVLYLVFVDKSDVNQFLDAVEDFCQ